MNGHKKEIIELSDKNAYAQAICNYFGWLNEKITIEDVLKEINEYLHNQTIKITNFVAIKDELKTTGGKIGYYLNGHKKEIIELSDKNAYAQAICNYFGWLNEKITIEDVLKEINEYLQNQKEKIKSCRIIKDELKTTGGKIGYYLNGHKKEIIELSDKNAYAQAICNYFGWLNEKITIEDVLKEINEYLQKQKEEITSCTTITDTLKTTGVQIGYYLRYYKDEIIELAINGNSDALYICNYFKSFQKMLYKKIDEIANADSHFQNVVDNLEKGKENIDGRELH